MHQVGLVAQRPRKRRSPTDSDHPWTRYPNRVRGVQVLRPEQIWVADITYVRLAGEFVYLAVLMDVFTRAIRGWHLSRSLDHELTLTALRRALAHGVPAIHHSDQGVQYAATAYITLLEEAGVLISRSDLGEPTQNGYAERLIRTIKEEEVYLSDYQGFADAYQQIATFLEDVYLHKRIHSALDYLTPTEFEEQWYTQQHYVFIENSNPPNTAKWETNSGNEAAPTRALHLT